MLSKICWIPSTVAKDMQAPDYHESGMISPKKGALLCQFIEAGLWGLSKEKVETLIANVPFSERQDYLSLFKEVRTDTSCHCIVDEAQDILFYILKGVKPSPSSPQQPLAINAIIQKFCQTLPEDQQKLPSEWENLQFEYASFSEVSQAKVLLSSYLTKGCCLSNKEAFFFSNSFLDGTGYAWEDIPEESTNLVFRAKLNWSSLKHSIGYTAQTINIEEYLLEQDYIRARLPAMEKASLQDSLKGHWDLFWSEDASAGEGYERIELPEAQSPRNPIEDIKEDSVVAIDFGTRSTVVAIRNDKGKIRLCRIGMHGFQATSLDQQYENPTALEIKNYANFIKSWDAVPFRPFIRWEDISCSLEARAELHNTQVYKNMVGSGFTELKTWARRPVTALPLRLHDQQGVDVELYTPEHDIPSDLTTSYAPTKFNPIELYAYFVGLNINNQMTNSIYNHYYMTFPVKFNRETRDRILNSFRRGLLRSLPASLAYSPQWNKDFTVEESGSEPTAYAAAVLPKIGLNPEGVLFGVFDFGGGTTDFSFGKYRPATEEEEEDNGWETILEVYDTAGDENLGGEHLLRDLVKYVVEKNVDSLIKDDIKLTIPFALPEGLRIRGAELIEDTTRNAQGNTIKLCEALRAFWENTPQAESEEADPNHITLLLWNRAGQDVPNISLAINKDEMTEILRSRITEGVNKYFAAFDQMFSENFGRDFDDPASQEVLHILLAGNSCRSPLVKEIFNEIIAERAGETQQERYRLHDPLLEDERTLDAPTLKTGVAIGLLSIVPGETLGVVEHYSTKDETPFRYAVGRFKQHALVPAVKRNAPYGQWFALGKVRPQGWEVLGYTLSPLADKGLVPDSDCLRIRHKFSDDEVGKQIFVRAIAPNQIELSVSGDDGQPNEECTQTFTLKEN